MTSFVPLFFALKYAGYDYKSRVRLQGCSLIGTLQGEALTGCCWFSLTEHMAGKEKEEVWHSFRGIRRCGGGGTGWVAIAFIHFAQWGFVSHPFYLSPLSLTLSVSTSLPTPPPPSLSRFLLFWLSTSSSNGIVVRSTHFTVPLIAKKKETGSKFADMLWQSGVLEGSRRGKCLPALCRWRVEVPGNFYRLWKTFTSVIVCVQGCAVCKTRPVICLDSMGWERASRGDGTSKTVYQDLIYFHQQFSVFMRLH